MNWRRAYHPESVSRHFVSALTYLFTIARKTLTPSSSRLVLFGPFCRFRVVVGVCCLLLQIVCLSGCAVHYYSKRTNTEHVWGFGHLKMRTGEPNEGLQAIVHGTDVIGLSLGKAYRHSYATLGWERLEFIDVRQADVAFRLERPGGGFVNVRLGSKFPMTAQLCPTNQAAQMLDPPITPHELH